MTTRKNKPQTIIAHGSLFEKFLGRIEQRGVRDLLLMRGLAPFAVDGAIFCGRDDPTCGARRQSVRKPMLQRRGECFLDCLLGEIDVAEHAREDGDRATVLLAEDAFDLGLGGHGDVSDRKRT